jgi:hypothetical protein
MLLNVDFEYRRYLNPESSTSDDLLNYLQILSV